MGHAVAVEPVELGQADAMVDFTTPVAVIENVSRA